MTFHRFRPLARLAASAVTLFCATTCASAAPQQRGFAPSDEVDWYFASTFGTGVDRVGDRTV